MTPAPEGLDWRSLTVELNGRHAIYAERFPSLLAMAFDAGPDPDRARAGFTQQVARNTLETFAGAWPNLGPIGGNTRWHYISLPNDPTTVGVFAFRGTELAPGWIMVDAVHWVPS